MIVTKKEKEDNFKFKVVEMSQEHIIEYVENIGYIENMRMFEILKIEEI